MPGRRLALLALAAALIGTHCRRDPSPASTPDATARPASSADAAVAARPEPSPSSDPAARAREALAAWTDALNRRDAEALAALYADPVRLYGRDVPRARVLREKAAALAHAPTFRQDIVGPIAVEPLDTRLVTSFLKRSGPAGHARDVRAKVVFVPHDPLPLIVEETDEPSEHASEAKRRDACESVVGEVVNALPDVKKTTAELMAAVDAADGGVTFGGVGPNYDDEGGFEATIGVDHPERFENVIFYDVDAAGNLKVSIGATDVAVPASARDRVRRACAVARPDD